MFIYCYYLPSTILFMWFMPCHVHGPVRCAPWWFPNVRRGDGGTEKFSQCPQVTQLVKGCKPRGWLLTANALLLGFLNLGLCLILTHSSFEPLTLTPSWWIGSCHLMRKSPASALCLLESWICLVSLHCVLSVCPRSTHPLFMLDLPDEKGFIQCLPSC